MDTFEEFDQPIGPEKSAGAIIAHAFEIYKGIFMYGIAAVLITSLISLVVQPISGFNSADLMEEMKDNGDTFPSVWQVPGLRFTRGFQVW